MKKMLFSAIAMVAFSVSGFASTEVVEKNEKIEAVTSDTPCADQWSKDYNALRDAGYSHNTAVAIANADFNDCIETNYPSTNQQTRVGLTRVGLKG